MKSLIACKVNTFSRDKQEKILLYVYAFRSNMSKSVLSLAMACFSSLHFYLQKKERYVWAYPSFLLYISYSLLFDSVLLFIRSQVFFVLFKFSCIIVDAILIYCLQETI